MMCIRTCVVAAVVGLTTTSAFAAKGGKGANAGLKEEVASLKQEIKTAVQAQRSGDHATALTDAQKAQDDWKALPPAVQELIKEKHPELVTKIHNLLKHIENAKNHKKTATATPAA
jgi:gas vesicle protein